MRVHFHNCPFRHRNQRFHRFPQNQWWLSLTFGAYFFIVKIFNYQISTGKLFRLVFHLVFWTVWIFFPIVNAGDNEKFRQFYWAIFPIVLTNIPLFLLNSEWLIPKVFRRRGLPGYLLALFALIAVFSVLHLVMKEWLVPLDLVRKHWDVFWAVVPVIFLTAISTGYGFIVYLLEQDKARQEEQQERLKSELSFLRSQISPHFIFNILNSIVYLIRSKSSQAEAVTIKLSELMRYMLYESGDTQVPLDKEMDYLKNYVELQKIRFEEDVEIRLEMEGNPGSHVIEPMLMIPFVENAFKHGVGMIPAPVIDISLKVTEAGLDFFVKNKIAPESSAEKDGSSGIGLRNVKRRLELLYPGDHILEISENGEWFVVHLNLRLNVKSRP